MANTRDISESKRTVSSPSGELVNAESDVRSSNTG